MKKVFYSIVAIIALFATSSCEDGTTQANEPLQNKVLLCDGCDFDVYNGEELGYMYWCQFATTVDIVISDCNNNVLQEISRQLKPIPADEVPGYGILCFKIDVGDYHGKATFAMKYEDWKNTGEAPRVNIVFEDMMIGKRAAVSLDDLQITRIYEEIVHFSIVVGDADMLAFTWMPASEYVEQSADEIFEKGWVVDMLNYGSDWGGGYRNPKTYVECIDKLTPDTEYVLQLAAKNGFSVTTEKITFRTKAPEPPTPPVDFKSLEVVSITDHSITLTAEIANAEQLGYHICEGDSCDCDFLVVMAGWHLVWLEDESESSFKSPIKITFDIKNLLPDTAYYIKVDANARYTSQSHTIVATTKSTES